MEETRVNGVTITNNMFWRLFERFGAQGVSLIVSIVLARLLDPTVYGTVAIITIISTFLQVFVDGGFGNALIQKKDADDVDFSTVFYFNVVICIVLYFILFFLSPLISSFFKNNSLTPIIRVSGITIVISGLKNVQQAYVSRNLLFKKFFYSTLAGTIGAAILGITLALLGFGVWALVLQGLFNIFVDTIVLWITVKWRPKLLFSFKRLKSLFGFGSKLFATNLFAAVYNETKQVVIGRFYPTEDLAFYNKGKQFPELIATNIETSVDSVLFPVLSKKQDNPDNVKRTVKSSFKMCFYVISPIMIGLAMCADSLISVLLTDKWLPCVFFLRFICFSFMFDCITHVHINATKAMGKGKTLLFVDIVKKTVTMAIMLLTIFISLEWFMYSTILTTLFAYLISAIPNRKIIGYGLKEQLNDLLPILLLDFLMGLIVYRLGFLDLKPIFLLPIQVGVGVSIYFFGSIFFKIDSFFFLVAYFKHIFEKRKQR